MEAETATSPAFILFQKATAAGLSQVTAEHSVTHVLNYQSPGRKVETASQVSFKGSDQQLATFKASLEGQESEGIDFERLGPGVGEDCPAFGVYSTADGSERSLTWSADDNKVYLLDFWATWCGPCQKPMAHNQEMLDRNPSWSGLAEILAISLDDSKEEAETRIRERGWSKVSSYWGGPGGFQAASPLLFRVSGIPTCVLVKKGKIVWRGHPSERNLEADITHLLSSDSLPVSAREEESSGPVFDGETLAGKLNRVEAVLAEFIATGHTSPFFVYILTTSHSGTGEKKKGNAISGGSFSWDQKKEVETLLEKLKLEFPVISERLRFN